MGPAVGKPRYRGDDDAGRARRRPKVCERATHEAPTTDTRVGGDRLGDRQGVAAGLHHGGRRRHVPCAELIAAVDERRWWSRAQPPYVGRCSLDLLEFPGAPLGAIPPRFTMWPPSATESLRRYPPGQTTTIGTLVVPMVVELLPGRSAVQATTPAKLAGFSTGDSSMTVVIG